MSQNDLLIFGVVIVVVLLASPGLLVLFKSMQRSDRLISRLESRKDENTSSQRTKRQRTRSVGEVVVELGKRASPGNAEQLSAIRFKLLRAGFLNQKSVAIYFAIRLFLVVPPQVILLFFVPTLSEMHKFGPIGASLLLANARTYFA